jgi:hypothetical protein
MIIAIDLVAHLYHYVLLEMRRIEPVQQGMDMH